MSAAETIVENVLYSSEFAQYRGTAAIKNSVKPTAFPWLKLLVILGLITAVILLIHHIRKERQHTLSTAIPSASAVVTDEEDSVT